MCRREAVHGNVNGLCFYFSVYLVDVTDELGLPTFPFR
ncbi:hypothetical protein BURKHO8Y_170400 [Burkholderia sp. 8Y]|nr:hypothetical protein BURKHO8Y_170400 [Burkholderia sp. 8Y]